MFMFKEFVGYFAKIIFDIIEVRHDKLFVLGYDAHRYNFI